MLLLLGLRVLSCSSVVVFEGAHLTSQNLWFAVVEAVLYPKQCESSLDLMHTEKFLKIASVPRGSNSDLPCEHLAMS